MEAQSKKSRGVNLNPLAPAQSKRTFTFSGEIRNFSEMHPFQLPFSFLFVPFSSLFKKSRARGPWSGPKAIKIHQNGHQGRPDGAQESPN